MTKKIIICSLIISTLFVAGCDPKVYEAKREIASAMRDPSSAEFRNVVVFPVTNGNMVCGEVSGKNGFGAMAGFMHFLYRAPLMRIATNSQDNFAIHQCCKVLRETGALGTAKNTKDIEGCAAISPAMAL
jgi:hypothetical protein